MNRGTIMQRRKQTARVSKAETLLILRAYQANPTKWSDVLDDIKGNLQQLPPQARHLYETASLKQWKDRMSSKFGKLLTIPAGDISDPEIRTEVEAIKLQERRLVEAGNANARPDIPDRRDQVDAALSDDENEVEDPQPQQQHQQQQRQQPAPVPRQQREQPAAREVPVQNEQPRPEMTAAQQVRRRKRPLASLIRENQLEYNRFIKKKVPKLLRMLGVSSSEEDG